MPANSRARALMTGLIISKRMPNSPQGSNGDEVEHAQDDAHQDNSAEVESQVFVGFKAEGEKAVDDAGVEGREPGDEVQLEGEAGDGGDGEVGERAGAGGEGERGLGVSGRVRVHRHRVSPAATDE